MESVKNLQKPAQRPLERLVILMPAPVMETAAQKAGLVMVMQIVKTRLMAVISPVMIMTEVTVGAETILKIQAKRV